MTTPADSAAARGARFFKPPPNWASLSAEEQQAWAEEVADALLETSDGDAATADGK